MIKIEEMVEDVEIMEVPKKAKYFLSEDSPSPVSPPTPYSPPSPPDYSGPDWSGD